MNLHEQYAELVRRGMPEHESVFAHSFPMEPGDPGTGWMIGEPGTMSCQWCSEDDARDLITCHALRWFNDSLRANGKRDHGAVYLPDDPLDAILAATEHLGVKG